ncbi:hypothetical protein SCA6_020356 [Theobroma cacao]
MKRFMTTARFVLDNPPRFCLALFHYISVSYTKKSELCPSHWLVLALDHRNHLSHWIIWFITPSEQNKERMQMGQ